MKAGGAPRALESRIRRPESAPSGDRVTEDWRNLAVARYMAGPVRAGLSEGAGPHVASWTGLVGLEATKQACDAQATRRTGTELRAAPGYQGKVYSAC